MRYRTWTFLIALAVIGFIAIPYRPHAEAQERTFIYAANEEPPTVDPHVEFSNPAWRTFEAIYEALLDYDPSTLEPKPRLAQSWTQSSDGLQYTFRLRPNVRFHDGTTMDAEAVKYSFERMKKIGLGLAFVLDRLQRVDVLDKLTVRFTLSGVDPTFVNGVPLVYIVSPQAFKKNERDNDLGRSWATINEAGTGPYRLESWKKRQALVLVKFLEYWRGWNKPHIAKFIFTVVQESATQRQLVERGSAHLADTIVFDDIDAMKKNPRVQIWENESLRQFYLFLNTTKPPLNDVRVRRALAAAFDPVTLATKVLQGHAVVPRGPLPTKMLGFDRSLPAPKQDLALAKRLLTEAGYPSGGFTLTWAYVYYAPYDWQRINGEIMQAALGTLGINLKVEGLPFPLILQRVTNPATWADIWAWSVPTPTPDPDSLLYPVFHSQSKFYVRNGYVNPGLDRILDEARSITDTKKRMELYARAQRLLMEDLPAIPMTILNDVKAANADVRGYRFQPMRAASVNWYDLYFESR